MIRLAGTSDIPRIEALMKSVAGFWDEGWRPDVLQRALAPSESIALVHEEDDTIDGFVCGHDVGFRAYLSELVVSRHTRGGGAGWQLTRDPAPPRPAPGSGAPPGGVWRAAAPSSRSPGGPPPAVVLLRKHLNTTGAQPAS